MSLAWLEVDNGVVGMCRAISHPSEHDNQPMLQKLQSIVMLLASKRRFVVYLQFVPTPQSAARARCQRRAKKMKCQLICHLFRDGEEATDAERLWTGEAQPRQFFFLSNELRKSINFTKHSTLLTSESFVSEKNSVETLFRRAVEGRVPPSRVYVNGNQNV